MRTSPGANSASTAGDEVLDAQVARHPVVHFLGELGQVGLGEGQLAENRQNRGAPANRVEPFALDVTDDEARPVLGHGEVVKVRTRGLGLRPPAPA